MSVEQAVNAERVAVSCTIRSGDHVAAKQGLERWRANDPQLMSVLRAGNLITFMDSTIGQIDHDLRTVDDCTNIWWHKDLVTRMAELNAEAAALDALREAASTLGVKSVNIRRLAPFLGSARISITDITAPIASTLDALGIRKYQYVSWRSHGATPRRTNIDYNFRMLEEECAKLLRTVHAVSAAREGRVDPEIGPEPLRDAEKALLDSADLQKLRGYLQGQVSGHSFRPKSFLAEIGLRSHVARVVVRRHKSHRSDPMYMIFANDGSLVKSMVAVRELELLWLLANETGADVRDAATKHGRGTRARLLAAAILDAIGH